MMHALLGKMICSTLMPKQFLEISSSLLRYSKRRRPVSTITSQCALGSSSSAPKLILAFVYMPDTDQTLVYFQILSIIFVWLHVALAIK